MLDFFNYFPVPLKDLAWGLNASAFGEVQVSPGASYPPSQHPEGHHFSWEKGRVLQEYQLIYIHQGSGTFESSLTQPTKLNRGTAFLLFPGLWHRYRPEPSTGWTESWIELNGSMMDRLRTSGIIAPDRPILPIESINEVENLLKRASILTRTKPPGFAIRLGLIAIEILTLVRAGLSRQPAAPRHIVEVVSKAQAIFSENAGLTLSPAQVARKIGVSYSYFRREFKQQTGFSPKQYQIEIRRRRAKDLLQNTSQTVKEISEQLGYSSPYHLTLDFSKGTGVSPSLWRKK